MTVFQEAYEKMQRKRKGTGMILQGVRARMIQMSLATAVTLISSVVLSRQAFCGPITEDFRPVVDRIAQVLTDPAYAAPEKKQERDRILHGIASERFDWEEMAKRSLGARWRELREAQQREFIEVFVDFLERMYLSKIDMFLQKTKDFSTKNIAYTNETVSGNYALLESKIMIQDQEFPLQYKLIQKSGNWKVYDVTIEGVGLVANYRSQFNEILARESFDSLIKRLRAKQDGQLTAGKTQQKQSDNATPSSL